MGNTADLRKRLLKLFDEDPRCRYCQKLTSLDGRAERNVTKDTATIDHVYSKYNPRRGKKRGKRTLACYECNLERAKQDRWKFGKRKK